MKLNAFSYAERWWRTCMIHLEPLAIDSHLHCLDCGCLGKTERSTVPAHLSSPRIAKIRHSDMRCGSVDLMVDNMGKLFDVDC